MYWRAISLAVPAAFVYKRRHGPEETEVTAVSTRLSGENVVIYDDMIRTGGSLLNAAHAYRESGAGKLFAIATHGEFAGDAFSRIRKSGLFEAIACTDSHPRANAFRSEGLIVKSVAELFLRGTKRQSELAEMIGRAGLEQVRFRNLTGGVAALHSAWRL